jgi:RNA polymerase sigma factor (sigma-70 family)
MCSAPRNLLHSAGRSTSVTLYDEAKLLEAWRGGDAQAGAAIVERHFESVYKFFRSKVSGDVDDLVQQTFISCLEARDGFRGECSFRTLLFAIARRRLYDYFRERRRVKELDFTTTSVRALGTSPSGALLRRDNLAMLREALRELPVDSQMLLELQYWEEFSTQELAQVFEVAEGTIKSRLFYARARLRALLAERGYLMVEPSPDTTITDVGAEPARDVREHTCAAKSSVPPPTDP